MTLRQKARDGGKIAPTARPAEPLIEGASPLTLERLRMLLDAGRKDEVVAIGKAAVPALIKLLIFSRDTDEGELCNKDDAMYLLKKMGVIAIPELSKALSTRNDDARDDIAKAIIAIVYTSWGKNDEVIASALVRILGTTYTPTHHESIKILVKIGAPAIPPLFKALLSKNATEAQCASDALGKIAKKHPKEVASAIADYVNGRGGDNLAVTDTETGELFKRLDVLMRKCAMAMKKCGEGI